MTRALVEVATSEECLGEPMLDGLIDWLSGDGPLDAMEKVPRERGNVERCVS